MTVSDISLNAIVPIVTKFYKKPPWAGPNSPDRIYKMVLVHILNITL